MRMHVCLCLHVSVCVFACACACACMLHTRVALPQMEALLIWGADSVSMIDWFGFSAYDQPFPRRKISIKSGAEKPRYYTMATEDDLEITVWFSDVSTELGPFGWQNHVFSVAGNFSFNFWHFTRHSGYEMWQMKDLFTFWYMDNWVMSSVLTQQSPEDQTPAMSLCHIVLRGDLCPLQHICASTHQFQTDRFLFHRQKEQDWQQQSYFHPPRITSILLLTFIITGKNNSYRNDLFYCASLFYRLIIRRVFLMVHLGPCAMSMFSFDPFD